MAYGVVMTNRDPSQDVSGEDVSGSDLVTVVVGRFQPLVAAGLAEVLIADPRVAVLGSDLDGEVLESVIARTLPRVAILGETAGYDLVVRLRSRRPPLAVVLLARDDSLRHDALLAVGVRSLSLSSAPAAILAALHRVADGEEVSLTRRETQVLTRLGNDMSYSEIALELHIADVTVRTYARAIYRKLGVKNRHELASHVIVSAQTRDRI